MKKRITFVYMYPAEKQNYMPIAEEAKRRGYEISFTDDAFAKCEIGFYCQHINFPQYSKFSIIMLHDITQQYGNWPDIWMNEPWNKYDVGFLPNNQWVKNWKACSDCYYTRPRYGVYKAGWPKADAFSDIDRDEYRQVFYCEHGLDINKKTVLYAPAWENDHKQDDFVQAMLPLDVNILIKQNTENFPEVLKNIEEMYELHKNNSRVHMLKRETNIFDAILASDILVSDESSTMAEATMMGIPAISVSNWLIPDTNPSRYPAQNYDFVVTTKKENLSMCVDSLLKNYNKYKKRAEEYRDSVFCNIGNTSKIIMDVVDSLITGTNPPYKAINATTMKKLSLSKYMHHKYIIIYREISNNYCKRYKLVNRVWNTFRKVKHILAK